MRLFLPLDLPAAVVAALGDVELEPVPGVRLTRPGQMHFTPHVTIARLGPPADTAGVNALLRAGKEREFGSFVARKVVSFNSVTLHDGAAYECIQSYALT